jgi:ribosomal protein S18 acetylase RimI-like enzyme
LPSLGPGFLSRLYRALGSEDDAVALVAENGAGVVGFATGVVSVRSFYRRFYRRHGLASAVSALPYLVRPAVFCRALETARYPVGTDDLPDSELLSIAVDDAYRAQGVGRLLAAELMQAMAAKGVADMKVVVGADNVGANRFYERLGFTFRKSIAVHDSSASNVWVTRCISQ